MIPDPVTSALKEMGLEPGDHVLVTVGGKVTAVEPGQVHLLVSRVSCAHLNCFRSWEEWFTIGNEKMATIKDWVG
jgi:hypothetical protein